MYEHKVILTPMNIGFGNGLNTIVKADETEYTSSSSSVIYIRDPEESWFKMKSNASSSPYLESGFYGLNPGDTIEVECEALALAGNPKLDFRIIVANASYTEAARIYNESPSGLTEDYRKYKANIILPNTQEIKDAPAIVLNLRTENNVFNNELILKNIIVTIKTTNPKFGLTSDQVAYQSKTDYLKCIDLYAGTNINTAYNALLAKYTAGNITFPDDQTVEINVNDYSTFKGLMAIFNGHKYRPSITVYMEYKTNGTAVATAKNVKEDGTFAQEGGANAFGPTGGIYKKRIAYFNGGTEYARKTLVDVGYIGTPEPLSIRSLIISIPQFNDHVKRPPNQIDELYTNLSAKLR